MRCSWRALHGGVRHCVLRLAFLSVLAVLLMTLIAARVSSDWRVADAAFISLSSSPEMKTVTRLVCVQRGRTQRGRTRKRGSRPKSNHSHHCNRQSAELMRLLLIRGGVEINPGPVEQLRHSARIIGAALSRAILPTQGVPAPEENSQQQPVDASRSSQRRSRVVTLSVPGDCPSESSQAGSSSDTGSSQQQPVDASVSRQISHGSILDRMAEASQRSRVTLNAPNDRSSDSSQTGSQGSSVAASQSGPQLEEAGAGEVTVCPVCLKALKGGLYYCIQHLNITHGNAQRAGVRDEDMLAGTKRCGACTAIHLADVRHVCGRASVQPTRRGRKGAGVRVGDPSQCPGDDSYPTLFNIGSDAEFCAQRGSTVKTLEPFQWPVWREQVMSVLRGFARKNPDDQEAATLRFTEIVRHRLSRARKNSDAKRVREEDNPEETMVRRMVDRQVQALVKMGALGRACRRMTDKFKVLKVSEAVLEILRKLHPQEDTPELPARLLEHQLAFTVEEVKHVVKRKLAKGAAAGMDGWTRELLLPIVENSESCRDFTALINCVINKPEGRIWDRLMACPIIPLDKDPGVRPIAVESTLIKVMAHLCLRRIPTKEWKEVFPDFQYGAGPDANVERAVLRIRRLLNEDYPIALSLDCANAYNTISREAIVKALLQNQALWPIYKLTAMSMQPSKLCVMENGVARDIIMSKAGVRQGSVLGPVLFALGLQSTLNRTASTGAVKVVAYLDDITLLAKNKEDLLASAGPLVAQLHDIGLCVNESKSVVICSPWLDGRGIILKAGSQPIVCAPAGPTKLLGAAMYFDDPLPNLMLEHAVSTWVTARAGKQKVFFERLRESQISDSAKMAMLRNCGNYRINFLLRTHPQWATADAAAWFDAQMLTAVMNVVGSEVAEVARARTTLRIPVSKGGLGIRKMGGIAEFAYEVACNDEKGIVGLSQKDRTTKLDAEYVEKLNVLNKSDLNAQKLHRTNVKSSLMTVPVFKANANEGYHQWLRERCGLLIAAEKAVCVCGQVASTYHLRTCGKINSVRIHRHDQIKMALGMEARKRFVTHIEPHGMDLESRERPDITIFRDGQAISLDVAVVYPCRSDSNDPLQTEAAGKCRKYQSKCPTFLPFIVGSSGEFHRDCDAVFNIICTSMAEKMELRKSIYEILLRENARLVKELTRGANNYIPLLSEEAGLSVDAETSPSDVEELISCDPCSDEEDAMEVGVRCE